MLKLNDWLANAYLPRQSLDGEVFLLLNFTEVTIMATIIYDPGSSEAESIMGKLVGIIALTK